MCTGFCKAREICGLADRATNALRAAHQISRPARALGLNIRPIVYALADEVSLLIWLSERDVDDDSRIGRNGKPSCRGRAPAPLRCR